MKVTFPLNVFGPHAGEPVVEIFTRDTEPFDGNVAEVVKSTVVLPVPVTVLAVEPSITLSDQPCPKVLVVVIVYVALVLAQIGLFPPNILMVATG